MLRVNKHFKTIRPLNVGGVFYYFTLEMIAIEIKVHNVELTKLII